MTQEDSETHPGDSTLNDLDRALASPGADPLMALASLLQQARDPSRAVEATTLQGSTIAGYELVRLIGVGGMGATYRGLDPDHNEVAIKIVDALSELQKQRFESECQILRRLEHPGIVRYRHHGVSEDGNGYLVMDFVPAQTLQQILDGLDDGGECGAAGLDLIEDIEEAEAHTSKSFQRRMIRLIASVAEALAFAHAAGIIHRDVKPANILVQPGLQPVLIDFGLGRDLFRNVTLTRTGAVMGTLSYMAPEQLRGDDAAVDARADVFSLGLVLYRCLTGRDLRGNASRVFSTSRGPIMFGNEDVAHLARPLQAIIYNCLDPRRRKRYQEVGELASDLRAVLGSGTVKARYPGFMARCARTRRGRVLLATPVVVVIVALSYLQMLPGHYLSVDTLNDGGLLYIDDDPRVWVTPLTGLRISEGPHVLRLEDENAKIRREIFIDRRHTRITVMNPRLNRMSSVDSWTERADAAYLRIDGGADGNAVWVGDRSIESFPGWIRLKPGPYRMRAVAVDGTEEVQDVELRPSEVHLMHLLYEHIDGVKGSFRYSMTSVLSPHPTFVTFRMDEGAVRFLNGFPEAEARGDQIAKQSIITTVIEGQEVAAVLRIQFPARMHSVVFTQLSNTFRTGKLRVDYRTENTAWQSIFEGGADHYEGLIQAVVGPKGTLWFELRGRMLVQQVVSGYSTAKFLAARLDCYDEGDQCCFAIVADPVPGRARIK